MFTPQQRETVITLIERGQSVKDACQSVGISERTFRQWVKDGNQAADGSDKAIFARRYEIAKIRQADQGLTEDELVKLLESVARDKRSIRAIELLLCQPWKRSKDLIHDEPEKPKSMADELAEFRAKKAADGSGSA